MKTDRRRLDVDVEELDRVIDAAENGPLSKADRQKLKTTLHALVERLAQKRNTEKTNSVLEPKNSSPAAAQSPDPVTPVGHGRNAASAFTGAEKVSVQHTQLKPGDPSDDNPFSEAHFKTMKYRPDYPDRFGSIQDARRFCQDFFAWYNHQHHHSGLQLLTPATVHYGQAPQLISKRQAVLDLAFQTHPERFVRRPPQHPW